MRVKHSLTLRQGKPAVARLIQIESSFFPRAIEVNRVSIGPFAGDIARAVAKETAPACAETEIRNLDRESLLERCCILRRDI